jgi:16S rRNA (guanine966-N2)-methyltransferase
MRIIAGKNRGLSLLTPETSQIRPTSDKIRQAVFNMLQSRNVVHQARVLDLFCGTGALGLEALSQGADFCLFCDRDKNSLNLAKHNAEKCNVLDQTEFEIITAPTLPLRPDRSQPFDLIFCDPPYHQDLIAPTLIQLKGKNWLQEKSICVCEMDRSEKMPLINGDILLERVYGSTRILLVAL